jgi:hypothetical protein
MLGLLPPTAYLRLLSVLDDRQVAEDGPATQGHRVLAGEGGVPTCRRVTDRE